MRLPQVMPSEWSQNLVAAGRHGANAFKSMAPAAVTDRQSRRTPASIFVTRFFRAIQTQHTCAQMVPTFSLVSSRAAKTIDEIVEAGVFTIEQTLLGSRFQDAEVLIRRCAEIETGSGCPQAPPAPRATGALFRQLIQLAASHALCATTRCAMT
jgi:hypothetical protein